MKQDQCRVTAKNANVIFTRIIFRFGTKNFGLYRIPYKKALQPTLGIPPIKLRWGLNRRFACCSVRASGTAGRLGYSGQGIFADHVEQRLQPKRSIIVGSAPLETRSFTVSPRFRTPRYYKGNWPSYCKLGPGSNRPLRR